MLCPNPNPKPSPNPDPNPSPNYDPKPPTPNPNQGPGPNGVKTLCSACSGRFRGGASGPPTTNEQGKYVCVSCERTFETISALSSHKRRCDGGRWRALGLTLTLTLTRIRGGV